jgi:uncharacterized protein YceH (UPF0502 family)
VDPDAVEIRILGCLLEKQRTTPDAYPLTLNGLRLACNQATNRDPVVDYDDQTLREALRRLADRRWIRLASGHSSRAAKYRHLLDEALGLGRDELALLAVLMLRGPQTPGELKQRSDRMHAFAGLDAVDAVLDRLIERGHVARLERRPGQKEERYAQLLGDAEPDAPAPPMRERPNVPPIEGSQGRSAPTEATTDLEERVARLEAEVAELRQRFPRP